VKILYIWVVAIVMVIAFGGPYRFPGFCDVLWKSAHSRSNMKPKSIPKQARKWIEELFYWFQVLWQHFMFFSFCILLHAFLFIFLHVPFICMHFAFILQSFPHMFLAFSLNLYYFSLNVPFIFIPMCIHVLLSSFSLHAFSFHFAFMSCHFLSKIMEMALWLGQGTECNKWLSLSYR